MSAYKSLIILFFMNVFAVHSFAGQEPSLQLKLSQLEVIIAREDSTLSKEISQTKQAIFAMIKNFRDRCLVIHSPLCEKMVYLYDDIVEVSKTSIRIYVLPMDLVLGNSRRMALNSVESRNILIDLELWLEQDSESQQLLLLTELARFMDIESEEDRYKAASEIFRDIHIVTNETTKAIRGGMTSTETDLIDSSQMPVTALSQDGKTFFSFTSPDRRRTEILVLNPRAFIFDLQCVQEDATSVVANWGYSILPNDQITLDICTKDIRNPHYRNSNFNFRSRTGTGIVSHCTHD